MNIEGFEVMFTSPPEYERLVAEIWWKGEPLAIIKKDKLPVTIELIPRDSGKSWEFELKTFLAAVKAADEGITDP